MLVESNSVCHRVDIYVFIFCVNGSKLLSRKSDRCETQYAGTNICESSCIGTGRKNEGRYGILWENLVYAFFKVSELWF